MKQFRASPSLWPYLLFALIFLAAGPARAACSNPTGSERDMVYNTDFHTYQFCNGTNWVAAGGSPWAQAAQFSNTGYFVLSATTYTGNLGDIWTPGGPDTACLTELATTHTGWKGYATANANGQLNADHVHAFLCDNGGACKQTVPLATYAFANAGDSTAGGATFTTDSSGHGPGDNASWNGLTYFNGDFKYWTGRRSSSGTTLWTTNGGSGQECTNATDWDTGTNAKVAEYGESAVGNTNGTRWSQTTNETCNNAHYIICFVNP